MDKFLILYMFSFSVDHIIEKHNIYSGLKGFSITPDPTTNYIGKHIYAEDDKIKNRLLLFFIPSHTNYRIFPLNESIPTNN